MKKSIFAAALALTMAGTLTACGMTGDSMAPPPSRNGAARTGSGYVGRTGSRPVDSMWGDGWYRADREGWVNGRGEGTVAGDLTQDARDLLRDTGDAVEDAGRAVGSAVGGAVNNADRPAAQGDSDQ